MYSSISGNSAPDGQYGGVGGGVAARGAILLSSTIDNNTSGYGGGLLTFGTSTTILNSTISGNTASIRGSGLRASGAVVIANSTIAFNQSPYADTGGIHFTGPLANSTLTLQSSIIAHNTWGVASTPSDIHIDPGHGVLAGADNLVIASNVSDPSVITVTTDPKLGPLQPNGGRTQTHMLLSGSPAMGKGNINGLPPSTTTDQRGLGYPRTTGPGASVDLGAVQFETIFADSFDAFF